MYASAADEDNRPHVHAYMNACMHTCMHAYLHTELHLCRYKQADTKPNTKTNKTTSAWHGKDKSTAVSIYQVKSRQRHMPRRRRYTKADHSTAHRAQQSTAEPSRAEQSRRGGTAQAFTPPNAMLNPMKSNSVPLCHGANMPKMWSKQCPAASSWHHF